MRLYHHKTDGGAEYLCSECSPGTNEGSLSESQYLIRIDGNINQDAELFVRESKPTATIKEYFPHDICPGCSKPSIPLEGVPDQSGRGCCQCGREWFEDLSRPATPLVKIKSS